MEKSKDIILVIDDETTNLELIQFYLGPAGYSIRAEKSGAAALEYLFSTADRIALIIVDILMPEISGYDVCRRIRQNEKYRFLPILISSGLCSAQDKKKAMEAGADDYVTKPFEKHSLLIRVNSLVRIGKLYRELIDKNKQIEVTLEKLKLTQDALIKSEKYSSIGNMAQGLAHEIYNPLTIISGNAERIMLRLKNNRPIDDIFLDEISTSIKNAANRCAKIVNSLQLYSSDSINKIEPSSVNEILKHVVSLLETKFLIKYNIKITHEYDSSINPILCDTQSLIQAFANIMHNAREAIENDGAINVETKLENNNILIIFTDSGPGFTETNLNCAFDPFFSSKCRGSHSGLGLPIALGIIKSHKGNITIKNNEKETGAIVTITIPANLELEKSPFSSYDVFEMPEIKKKQE